MRLLHSLPPYNFAGLDPEFTEFKKSRVVVLPVPYDSTTTYGTGARNGPHAIISASRFLELFDEELKTEIYKCGIFTTDELEPARGDAKETIRRVEEVVSDILESKKLPVILGGDHSITLGAIQAFAHAGKEISVLQLDAHADAKDELEGSNFGHSCVMRRVRELTENAVGVGVRAWSAEEEKYVKESKQKVFYSMSEVREKGIEKIASELCKKLGEKVYVTIDLDVLDPSEMPSVGTPEPGGMSFSEVTKLLRMVSGKREIVGFDLVELAPIPGMKAPNFLAARLAYKMIGYSLK